MPNQRHLQAYLQLGAAMCIVGSSVVAAKLITRTFPVFLAGGLRFAIAILIMIPLLAKAEGIPAVTKKEMAVIFWQAFTGIFGFSVFLLYGLRYTTAAASGIVTSATPAVLGLISFGFLKEKAETRKIVGLVLAVGGILALNIAGQSFRAALPKSWLGNTLVFGAVVCEALFTILGKKASRRLTPLAVSTFAALFGLVMFLPFAVSEAIGFDFGAVPLQPWLAIVYYGVVVTVGGFFLLYSGVSKVPLGTAAVFTGILPLSSMILSVTILGERIYPSQIIGFLLILTGIVYSSRETAHQAGTPEAEVYHEL